MSELPQGWATAVLADLIAHDGEFSDGDWVESKDQDPNGSIRLLQLADIGDGVFLDKSHRFINEHKFDQLQCTEVLEGDVLVARMPDPLGRSCLAPRLRQRCITVVDVAIVRLGHQSVQPAWLMHFLNAPKVRQEIEVQSSGTTRRRISRSNLAQVQLPVAPLNEQKRIADKLDAILARVDACRERLDRVPTILKRFRQAVLAAATSGHLTEEWRGDQTLDDWQNVSVEEIASEVFDGPFGSNLKSKDYSAAGVRVVRLENIGWLNFIADKETFIPQEKYEVLRKHTLRAKDVLFSSFIAEEVRVCLLPDGLSEQAINKADCFCVRTDPNVCLPEFLALRLACRSTFLALEQEVHGATRPRINLRQLKEFTFELPPLSEQREIVRCVEALFTYADRLEARYSAARAQVERLTPALLAKALCGELVPQDPSDEPASVLLERIRAARVGQPTAKRGRKPPATRVPRAPKEKAAMTKSRQDDDVQHKPYLAGLLREAGGIARVEELFRRAELPVTDFYKQLAWEVENGHIRDDETKLEAA